MTPNVMPPRTVARLRVGLALGTNVQRRPRVGVDVRLHAPELLPPDDPQVLHAVLLAPRVREADGRQVGLAARQLAHVDRRAPRLEQDEVRERGERRERRD